jgi:hypothetical protein
MVFMTRSCRRFGSWKLIRSWEGGAGLVPGNRGSWYLEEERTRHGSGKVIGSRRRRVAWCLTDGFEGGGRGGLTRKVPLSTIIDSFTTTLIFLKQVSRHSRRDTA